MNMKDYKTGLKKIKPSEQLILDTKYKMHRQAEQKSPKKAIRFIAPVLCSVLFIIGVGAAIDNYFTENLSSDRLFFNTSEYIPADSLDSKTSARAFMTDGEMTDKDILYNYSALNDSENKALALVRVKNGEQYKSKSNNNDFYGFYMTNLEIIKIISKDSKSDIKSGNTVNAIIFTETQNDIELMPAENDEYKIILYQDTNDESIRKRCESINLKNDVWLVDSYTNNYETGE